MPNNLELLNREVDEKDEIEDSINIDFQQRAKALDALNFSNQEALVEPGDWFIVAQELSPTEYDEILSFIKNKAESLETSSRVNEETTKINPGAIKEAEQTASVAALKQEVAQIVQESKQGGTDKEALHQREKTDWIKYIIDRIPKGFFGKLKFATILSAILFVIHGIADSSSTSHSNEHYQPVKPVVAESRTPEVIVLRDQTPTDTQSQAIDSKGNETDDFTRVPEPPTTTETEKTEENFDLSATVTAYLKNQAEFPNNLSEEQHIAFVQEMENQRGAQPIYFEDPGAIWINAGAGFAARYPEISGEILGQNEGVYRVAKDFLEKYPNIAKELTPTKYLPARVDKDTGNTQYLDNKTNQWITIPNSAGENRPNIDKTSTPQAIEENWLEWPQTEPLGAKYGEYANLTSLQAVLSGILSDQMQLTPVVLKNIELTKFPIYDTQLQTWWNKDFLQLLKVIKNHDGQPLYVVQFFATGTVGTGFFKEGSNVDKSASISESGVAGAKDWKRWGLYNNAQIWIAFNADQKHAWDFNLKASIINTKNTVPPSQCAADLLGDGKKQDNLLIELSSVTAPKQ